jgi:uncharacterized membrane protein
MPQTAQPHRRRARAAEHVCCVCGTRGREPELGPTALVRPNIATLIAARVPGWDPSGYICRQCRNRFRGEFVRAEMERDLGALTALEEEVMHSLRDGALVTDNINKEFESSQTFGERVADKVAQFGGSWRFIISFFVMMTVWIIANSVLLLKDPFDPYPYILLNLALSMLAAVQAPVILMSQNRQEDRDRMRAENDYQVNLKAELEIRAMNEKLDQLIHQQWAHLLEVQQIQMEMIEDMGGRKRS